MSISIPLLFDSSRTEIDFKLIYRNHFDIVSLSRSWSWIDNAHFRSTIDAKLELGGNPQIEEDIQIHEARYRGCHFRRRDRGMCRIGVDEGAWRDKRDTCTTITIHPSTWEIVPTPHILVMTKPPFFLYRCLFDHTQNLFQKHQWPTIAGIILWKRGEYLLVDQTDDNRALVHCTTVDHSYNK